MSELAIAIDAMGGDYGPGITVPATLRVAGEYPDVELVLVGDETALNNAVRHHAKQVPDNVSIRHASQIVEMDESPAQALKHKKDSSMRVALDLVKQQNARACISAGNTGALMGTARLVLKTLPKVARPAIMSAFPTYDESGEVQMLDLGANVDSHAEHLLQFAIMGSVAVSVLQGIDAPKIGLLNIGEEDIKGNSQVRQTAKLLAETPFLNYVGNIEGDDIFSGRVDLVVSDGFTGNITLKAIEGTAKVTANFVKDSFNRNWWSRMIGAIARPILNRVKSRINPSRHNGANLLGLQGVVIKSHGGADSEAFAYALRKAILEAQVNLPQKISDQVSALLTEAEQAETEK